MKKQLLVAASAVTLALFTLPALSQNLAIVNGKAVPKTRADALTQQLVRSGRPITPDIEAQIKEEVIAREIFMQEAAKRGLDATEDYRGQLELARQTILIRELFSDFQKNNPVTDADIKAEYDKFVAANGGKEYRARHILVEKEEQAKAILASLKKRWQVRRHRQEAVQGPGVGRQRWRPGLGLSGQLRQGILRCHGRSEEGPGHRCARQEPVWLSHHSPGRCA